jgi:hypothetical protein
MKPTNKTMHMSITIRFIEDAAKSSGEGLGYYFGNLTDEAARAHLDSLKAKGFKFAPTCDDVDAEGRCAGHAKP